MRDLDAIIGFQISYKHQFINVIKLERVSLIIVFIMIKFSHDFNESNLYILLEISLVYFIDDVVIV